MPLRMSPTNKTYEERLRQLILREEDRIIRIINGLNSIDIPKGITNTVGLNSRVMDEINEII